MNKRAFLALIAMVPVTALIAGARAELLRNGQPKFRQTVVVDGGALLL